MNVEDEGGRGGESADGQTRARDGRDGLGSFGGSANNRSTTQPIAGSENTEVAVFLRTRAIPTK